MSLRKAALVAAAGSIAGIAISLYYALGFSGWQNHALAYTISWAHELAAAIVFLLIFREQSGGGDPRLRQDFAIAATILSGILLHLDVTGANAGDFHPAIRAANWILDALLLPLCWIAFFILLVKDADPWQRRPMRGLAPLLTVLTFAAACWGGYFLFFRVGMAWLNMATQRSLAALAWEVLLLPLLELFRSLSVVFFAAVLWRYSRTARGRTSQIAGSSLPSTQEQNP